jgi:hypothetical protein
LLDLVEERERVMGRDQDEAGLRFDRFQGPEDRRVPDRVRDRASIELG